MSGNTHTDILLAGAIAAFTVDLLVYPLDTLKTRIQSPDYKRLFLNGGSNTINKPVLFRGLYQGVGSVIIATLPSSGAFFTTYEAIKSTLTSHNPHLTSTNSRLLPQPVIHGIASSIAELVSCAILTPAEVIKQNAQMVDSTKISSTNATVQTLAKFRSNPLALWRGYTALAGRNLPFTALQFPMFEKMRAEVKGYRERRNLASGTLLESGLVTAASAGTAGSIAAVITTPIDVIKTRIMLAAADGPGSESKGNEKAKNTKSSAQLKDALGNATKKPQARKSSVQIGREILAENGIKGLWRGGALRGAWTMLGSGLYLGVYESGRIWLARRRGDEINEDGLD
ncbi:mitochondrial carrier protein [Tothia fuscella]|uniref:Mitochondrial carrier protein n=1 Tax=Tothia fuscella TaxID=1048955 RepID=A0A9P4NNL8_9PEZI|nr:mitochondrial carrier protein [Tothia fuscella]